MGIGPKANDLDTHAIVRWEVPEGDNWLKITVVSKPLMIHESFYWRHHSNNNYGQGMKWSWWKWSMAGSPTIEVSDERARSLLTSLVYNHEPLKYLGEYFKIPNIETED